MPGQARTGAVTDDPCRHMLQQECKGSCTCAGASADSCMTWHATSLSATAVLASEQPVRDSAVGSEGEVHIQAQGGWGKH